MTGVQSQVDSYQRKWYLMPPCLIKWYLMPPCIIRYLSRIKRSNSRKGVAPSPTTRCSRFWKGGLRVAIDYGCQLYLFLLLYTYIRGWAEKLIWWRHIWAGTNEIQPLQNRLKYINCKSTELKNVYFCYIPWEYLSQPMKLFSRPFIYIYI